MAIKIGIIPIGQVDAGVLHQIKEKLPRVFPDTTCLVLDERLPIPEKAFDKTRRQHRSDVILGKIQSYGAARKDLNRVLGVVDADIFVSELNFVFGEATCPGKAALISLWRLKPEFYRDKAETELFEVRALKEAIHELGHTLGLRHCHHSSCVMYFSNSIFDTDKKHCSFCDQCNLQAALGINNVG